jgi:trimeric autotransporter adhesin
LLLKYFANSSPLFLQFITGQNFEKMKNPCTRLIFKASSLLVLMLSLLWHSDELLAQNVNITLTPSTLATFSTPPGTHSAVQSYTVSVNGWKSAMQISTTPGQHFYVSTSNDADAVWVQDLEVTPAKNKEEMVIYVRYSPPLGVLEPSHNATITHFISNNGGNSNVRSMSVSGVNRASIRFVGNFVNVVDQIINTSSSAQQIGLEGDWLTGPITLTAPLHFQISLNGTTGWTTTLDFAANTSQQVRSTFFVRFSPTDVGSRVSDVSATSPTADHQLLRVSGNAIANEPTIRPTLTITETSDVYMVLGFPGGNGQARLLVIRNGSAVSFVPIDKNSYGPVSSNFNNQGPGVQAYVHNGAGTSVTVTGLTPTTHYHFALFEYNDYNTSGAENYLVPGSITDGWTWADPLPVSLVSFSASLQNQQIVVDWATASEVNNHRFEVERSKDGIFFETVGVVKGAGNTSERRNYKLVDGRPISGTSYYRLRQVDYDGTTTYSKTVAVRNTSRLSRPVNLYPNPVVNTDLKIDLGFAAKNVQVQVVDMLGRVVLNEPAPKVLSEEILSLDLSRLNAGTYQLTIRSEEGNITRKFIKADR